MALAQISRFAMWLQTPVLIAVDDYNVLYSHANYHEWMNEVYRRQLQPHELRLASAFKLLERQVCPPCSWFSLIASIHGHHKLEGCSGFDESWMT